jgi:hypothetical protein
MGKDAHKDVRRREDSCGDRKPEARIDTAGDQYSQPAQNSDRDGFVMLRCTMRSTPASLAAWTRVPLLATARSNVTSPWGNRTQ